MPDPTAKYVVLRDPKTNEILIPKTSALDYEVVDSQPVPPYELNIDADTLQGYHASDFNEKLVSGTNIKTLNNQSILGSGDLALSGVSGASVVLTAAGWTQQENGSYAQTVSITGKGLTVNSNVIADCALSMSDLDADVEVLTAWGYVNNATLATDSITFYCYAATPDINIPVSVVIGG